MMFVTDRARHDLPKDLDALRRFIEYEVRARFPARWDETAPAECDTVDAEVERALREDV